MKIEEIKNLVSTFPSNSPYFQAIRAQYYPGTRKPTASQLSLFAMKDPALGWHLARLYFLAGQDLPKEIWWDAVRRAYACLKHPAQTKYTDQACHEALALGGPENPAFQAQLKAFLCSGLSYREIAARLGFSEEVVRLFAHLFFDFPERRENQLFVHSVLDPQSELGILPTALGKLQDQTLLLMNLAYRYGPDALAKAFGHQQNAEQSSAETTLLNAQCAVLATAELKAKLGLLETDQPEFAILKALLAEKAKQQQESPHPHLGLEALSYDQGAMLVFNKLVTDDARERLEIDPGYDSQAAAKVQPEGPTASGEGEKTVD